MAIDVLDFYIEDSKGSANPFLIELHEPTFCILVRSQGKIRELVLKMSGDVKCPSLNDLKDFVLESYRNYLIITEFLLGEQGQRVRESWGLSKEDFRELIFELYFCLVSMHSRCSVLKKAFLILVGLWKFHLGRKLR